MSTLQTTSIKHNASTSNNIVLDSGGNTIINGNATISGSATVGGVAVVTTTGTQTLTNKTLGSPLTMGTSVLTLMTAQNSTSGTFIDFTGIPSWVRRITIMFSGVGTNGSGNFLVRLGTSSGIVSTGYVSGTNLVGGINNTAAASDTTGFVFPQRTDGTAVGHMTITRITGNTWVSSHAIRVAASFSAFGAGDVALAAECDRVRITSTTGTDVFDAGSINIIYE